MKLRLPAALILAVALVSGAAEGRPLEPLEVDWERVFRLTWEVVERSGRPVVFGKIHNVSVYGVSRIQLLVEPLDAGGRAVTQHVAWVGYKINPGDSAFFDVPVRDRAATYRVRVFAFSRKFGTAGD